MIESASLSNADPSAGHPYAPSPTRTDEYIEYARTFDVAGVRFPAVMTRPSRPASGGWCLILIAGSQHADVDGNVPARRQNQHVYADLARQLATHGHSVLRYAKHGPQTGSVVLDTAGQAAHERFNTRVTVASAAIDLAVGLAPVSAPIALAGHSEGSIVATLLARDRAPEIAALICMSGPSGRRLDNMREQVALRLGMPRTGELADYDTAAAAIRAGRRLAPALFDHQQTRMLLPLAHDPSLASFIREVDAIDPSYELTKVDAPTLIIQGDRDGVVGRWHADALSDARRRRSLPIDTFHFPDLSHMYKSTSSGLGAEEWTNDTESDRRVSAAMDQWLRSVTVTRATGA
jgi:pimeloyl-ACP methyl ester carboxylesterase